MQGAAVGQEFLKDYWGYPCERCGSFLFYLNELLHRALQCLSRLSSPSQQSIDKTRLLLIKNPADVGLSFCNGMFVSSTWLGAFR